MHEPEKSAWIRFSYSISVDVCRCEKMDWPAPQSGLSMHEHTAHTHVQVNEDQHVSGSTVVMGTNRVT